MTSKDAKTKSSRFGKSQTDFAALGIASAAIILFVGTGGSVISEIVRSLVAAGPGPDTMLANAMILNIALIIFGWRRYRELTEEIGERRKAEKLAIELSRTDPLTGCLNRRSMTEAIEKARVKCIANDKALGFVMVDIDNFKQVNDANGHVIGDQLLVEASKRMREALPADIDLARLGGDEFAFILPYDGNDPERIEDLVSGLLERLSRPIDLGEAVTDITVSLGVATSRTNDINFPAELAADKLIHRADVAMYQAKNQGKNRCYWFEPTMEKELRFRLALETGIRRGVAEGEFFPYYEQQIDLETGEIVGFEMLARWHSPDNGVVAPEIFIPIAEDIGVIGDLSEGLLIQAMRDARQWDPSLTLAVNISPVQMRDPWFAQKLLKLLLEQNFPPHRLEIEITESCLHDNIDEVRAMIASLRNQGVRVSLDDFGTGYSSLEQLRNLPFDRLKIDKSFIGELRYAEAGSKIVDAIVSLGKGLNLPITAEGIEDEQILQTLRNMGKLKGQGYLYGRPETAEQVRERLIDLGRWMSSTSAHQPDDEQADQQIEDVPVQGRQSRRA